MKIVVAKPPIYDLVASMFTIDDSKTIYAYGDTIYNPADCVIPEELIAHESIHSRQQGKDPYGWWLSSMNP